MQIGFAHLTTHKHSHNPGDISNDASKDDWDDTRGPEIGCLEIDGGLGHRSAVRSKMRMASKTSAVARPQVEPL